MNDIYQNQDLTDNLLKYVKKTLIEEADRVAESQPEYAKKEKEFFAKLDKLPWEQQKKYLYSRYVQDTQTQGIQRLKQAIYRAKQDLGENLNPVKEVAKSFVYGESNKAYNAERERRRNLKPERLSPYLKEFEDV